MNAKDPEVLARLRRRRGAKWTKYGADVLPAWVADMDLPIADVIRAELQRLLDDDDVGYASTAATDRARTAFAGWAARRYGWRVDPDDVRLLADVVQGVELALHTLAGPGDGIVIQTPIYPPFLRAVEHTGRRLDDNPMHQGSARWELDLDHLAAIVDDRTRVLLLCNPHNPTGRVFARDELQVLADLAVERDLVVVSDEIHADLLHPGSTHIPFATLGDDVAARTITLTSATKAFNIAGVRCAVLHTTSPELRSRLDAVPRHVLGAPSAFGLAGTAAAWEAGDDWLDGTVRLLTANRDRVTGFVADRLPEIACASPEATYLAWLDCTAAGFDGPPVDAFLAAGVALNAGADFGPRSAGFARLNFATPPEVLDLVLERVAAAVEARR